MRNLADYLPVDYWRLRSLAYREYRDKKALPGKLVYVLLITGGDARILDKIPSIVFIAKYAYKARINSLMMAAEKILRRKIVYLKT